MTAPETHIQDDDTLRVLEFAAIRRQLVAAAVTPYGREEAQALAPAVDLQVVAARQAATTAAARLLQAGHDPMVPVPDIRSVLTRVAKEAQASAAELAQIRDFLQGIRTVQKGMAGAGKELEAGLGPLQASGEQLHRCQELWERLTAALDDEGEVRDDASPRLASLRQRTVSLRQQVRQRLARMTRSSVHEPHLQEQLVTRRQGRYVLPVKAGSRAQMPGIVHDRSSSGLTLFIEPLAVVDANNEVVELERQAEQEVARILGALSASVAAQAGALGQNVAQLGRLDLALACGRLSREQQAVPPRLNGEGRMAIKGGRHPLLTVDPVPIDLELGDHFVTLVITGPNTGGKTVTLKTVGLFVLMAQAGLHVPAEPGTELAVFRQVFADIGDEQSIEQSLSTFSGHLQRIVRFVRQADDQTLVLLDEIGAGTDPQEGAALAMALLDRFHSLGSRTVATTHFSQLKTYAYGRDGVENASVQFDVETLEPTYRLEMGLPGTSNAFAIASRLGLSAGIVRRARSFMDADQVQVARLIRELEEERRQEEAARHEAAAQLAESQRLRRAAQERLEAAATKREELLAAARAQARQLVEEAAREAEEVITGLREVRRRLEEALAGEHDAPGPQAPEGAVQEARRRLEERLAALDVQGEAPQTGAGPAPDELAQGTPVRVASLAGRAGTVIRAPAGEEDAVEVQVGELRITAARSDLTLDHAVLEQADSEQDRGGTKQRRWRVNARHDVGLSCMVRGLSVEEARQQVDRYLDRAFLAGRQQVVIIHGKGTGTLRRTLRAFLDEHSHVRAWHEAPPAEGGAGATVVQLVQHT